MQQIVDVNVSDLKRVHNRDRINFAYDFLFQSADV